MSRPVPGQVAMDAAPEWHESPGQVRLLDLLAVPCGVRYSDTQEGPLISCTLPRGHDGRHETRGETR